MQILPEKELPPTLRPGEASAILGVTTKTLAGITELRQIVLPSGHRRYYTAEILELANGREARTGPSPTHLEGGDTE